MAEPVNWHRNDAPRCPLNDPETYYYPALGGLGCNCRPPTPDELMTIVGLAVEENAPDLPLRVCHIDDVGMLAMWGDVKIDDLLALIE